MKHLSCGCLWNGHLAGKYKKITISGYGPNGQVLLSHPTPPCALGQVFRHQGVVQISFARDDICISGLLLELWNRDVKEGSAR